jgi:hypothetical protein
LQFPVCVLSLQEEAPTESPQMHAAAQDTTNEDSTVQQLLRRVREGNDGCCALLEEVLMREQLWREDQQAIQDMLMAAANAPAVLRRIYCGLPGADADAKEPSIGSLNHDLHLEWDLKHGMFATVRMARFEQITEYRIFYRRPHGYSMHLMVGMCIA